MQLIDYKSYELVPGGGSNYHEGWPHGQLKLKT